MSFFMLTMCSVATAAAAIQAFSHFGGSKFIFGNSKAIGVAIEFYFIATTLLTAGTVQGFVINLFGGLIAAGLLELGAFLFGGTKIIWSYSNVRNGRFGFSTKEVSGFLTGLDFADSVVKIVKAISTNTTALFNKLESELEV